uniref:Uncharacterized protein n=1 Tax=Cacopsylla melanoneura TaxID=428564 RepID=A0A8D8TVH0_9HEMI
MSEKTFSTFLTPVLNPAWIWGRKSWEWLEMIRTLTQDTNRVAFMFYLSYNGSLQRLRKNKSRYHKNRRVMNAKKNQNCEDEFFTYERRKHAYPANAETYLHQQPSSDRIKLITIIRFHFTLACRKQLTNYRPRSSNN